MSEKRFSGIVSLFAVIGLVLLLCAALMNSFFIGTPPSTQMPGKDNSGWVLVDEGGDSALMRTPVHLGVELEDVGDSVTIAKRVIIEDSTHPSASLTVDGAAPATILDNVLFFYNHRQGVTVRADDQVIYQMGEEGQTTKFSSACWCAVPLPTSDEPYTLSVTFTNLDEGSCILPDMSFTNADDIMVYFMQTDPIMFMAIPLWVILGIGLIVVAIIMRRLHILDRRVLCLGVFLLCSAGWSFTDSGVLCLLPVNQQIMSMLSYCFIMLMPVPMLYFAYWSSNNRRLKLKRFMLVFMMTNVLVQAIMYVTGFANMNEMLPVSQGIMLATTVYCFACIALDYRAKPTKTGRAQVIAFSMAMVLGVVAIFTYWAVPGVAYRTVLQLIILLFLLIMLIVIVYSMLQQNYSLKMQDAELQAYKKMSVIDSLTGLANRRAFDDALKAAWEGAENSNMQLVFLDLNGLKYTNDQFGHLAGDELILAAARSIDGAFGQVGTVYRIGGDEFAALVPGTQDIVYRGLEKLDELIAEYNASSTMTLSIARGFSPLRDQLDQRRSISDWKMAADKSMYRNKTLSRHILVRGSEDDYREVISSFASAVDAKDSYTADHSGRVGAMTDLICMMLGMSDSTLSQVHTAANLHDVGKIGVPDSILGKKGQLTEDEWVIMRSHPVIGEDIVKHTKAFYEVSQIIRHHHERYDGSGYPDGLVGNEIPIGSRIIAIADSIDAMTSNRSYRDAMPLDYCRQEIERGLGRYYDPAIGSIVLEHWSEIEKIVLAHPKDTRVLP